VLRIERRSWIDVGRKVSHESSCDKRKPELALHSIGNSLNSRGLKGRCRQSRSKLHDRGGATMTGLRWLGLAAVLALGVPCAQVQAGTSVAIGFGVPYYPRPHYHYRPYYYPPPGFGIYLAPPPVYYAPPPPVYVVPGQPVYAAPPTVYQVPANQYQQPAQPAPASYYPPPVPTLQPVPANPPR